MALRNELEAAATQSPDPAAAAATAASAAVTTTTSAGAIAKVTIRSQACDHAQHDRWAQEIRRPHGSWT